MSCYFYEMYSSLSIVMRMSFCHFCYVCVLNCDFTQENKAPARSLGMCLGKDVVVLVSYMLVGPTFLLNYITQLLCLLHKLLLSNYSPYLCLCKWQPPQLPFASALVTDWYQYSGCRATHAHGTTL